MPVIEFEYPEGSKTVYRIRPQNLMDADLFYSLYVDIANVISKARGYALKADTETSMPYDMPFAVQRLIQTFVQYQQCTSVQGAHSFKVNLLTFAEKHIPTFDAWVEYMGENSDFAGQWKEAFENANGRGSHPLSESGAESKSEA